MAAVLAPRSASTRPARDGGLSDDDIRGHNGHSVSSDGAMSAVAMTSAVTVSADITLAARVMSGAMADLERTAGPRGLLEEQHLEEGKTAARCQAAAAKQ